MFLTKCARISPSMRLAAASKAGSASFFPSTTTSCGVWPASGETSSALFSCINDAANKDKSVEPCVKRKVPSRKRTVMSSGPTSTTSTFFPAETFTLPATRPRKTTGNWASSRNETWVGQRDLFANNHFSGSASSAAVFISTATGSSAGASTCTGSISGRTGSGATACSF